MASMKTMLFVCLLVAAVVVPMAQANIIGPIISLPIGGLTSIIRVAGTVFCTVTGNANGGIFGGLLTPRFPGANVTLVCGNTTVSTVTTNVLGQFSFILDPSFFSAAAVQANCRVVVNTPTSSCNVGLPSTGTLTSALQTVANSLELLLSTVNLRPTLFVRVP